MFTVNYSTPGFLEIEFEEEYSLVQSLVLDIPESLGNLILSHPKVQPNHNPNLEDEWHMYPEGVEVGQEFLQYLDIAVCSREDCYKAFKGTSLLQDKHHYFKHVYNVNNPHRLEALANCIYFATKTYSLETLDSISNYLESQGLLYAPITDYSDFNQPQEQLLTKVEDFSTKTTQQVFGCVPLLVACSLLSNAETSIAFEHAGNLTGAKVPPELYQAILNTPKFTKDSELAQALLSCGAITESYFTSIVDLLLGHTNNLLHSFTPLPTYISQTKPKP